MLVDSVDLRRSHYWQAEPDYGDPYVAIRGVIAPEWCDLAPVGVEELLAEALGEVSPEGLETLLRDAKRVGGTLAAALPTVLPAVAQGAAAGALLGPAGAVAGGLLGGISAVASSPAQAAQPIAARPATAQPGTAQPGPAAPAAAQLLELLFRPEVIEALLAMALGQHGRREIQVGKESIPVAAPRTAS